MPWIDKGLEDFLQKNFPDRKCTGYYEYHTWQSSRYIYIPTSLKDETELHYEYFNDHVELHLEGKFQSEDYRDFAKELRIKTSREPRLRWLSWQGRSQCRCQLNGTPESRDDLLQAFKDIMAIFDPIISDICKSSHLFSMKTESYSGKSGFAETGLEKDDVSLETCSLGQIFSNPLAIPEYQRNYCWEDKQIHDLWLSLKDISSTNKYHLGTIILQKKKSENGEWEYDIIDGQQRLVTLTIILKQIKYDGSLPLLNQKFISEASRQHIGNSKYLIDKLCKQLHDTNFCQDLLYKLIFSVLILKENRLDLAYTFFSNQNAKGKALSDFDLLKAHHLRYISSEKQQEHMAGKWNDLIETKYSTIDATLSTHLFRLRKWMRKKGYNINAPHRVKEEYSAAPVVSYIPSFGESLDFYDKIQGGAHFFVYAENFVQKYSDFEKTPQVQSLRNHLRWESHWRYESVIESLLFGYYLKFGTQYLSEALISIAENIAQHRYTSQRALYYKIREFARDSEIIMMIDQASSPTFFLKECDEAISVHGEDLDEQGIALRFYQNLEDIKEELSQYK